MKLDFNKIQAIISERKMTKADFLNAAEISDFTLRNIQKGAPCRKSTGQLIADALGVSLEEIILAEEPAAAPTPKLDPLTETLQTIKIYGEEQYQKGKDEMCRIFLMAVKEAIDRWNETEVEG